MVKDEAEERRSMSRRGEGGLGRRGIEGMLSTGFRVIGPECYASQ